MSRPLTHEIETFSPAQTESLGRLLGRVIEESLVIGLEGELGAGKTSFTRGLVAGMGLSDRVSSPTYTLVNEYGTPQRRLIHMDIYRLNETGTPTMADLESVGLYEWMDEVAAKPHKPVTVVVVEWGDLIESELPPDRLEIRMVDGEGSPGRDGMIHRRTIRFRAHGPISQKALETFRQVIEPKQTV